MTITFSKKYLYRYTDSTDYLDNKKFSISDGVKISNNLDRMREAYDSFMDELKSIEKKYNTTLQTIELNAIENIGFYTDYHKLLNETVTVEIELLPASVFEGLDIGLNELRSFAYMIDVGE